MPIANLGKVRGDDGANVYIKYNSVAADAGAVDNFSSGTHKFIGMMTSTSKTKPVSGYTWGKFVGDDGNPGNPGAPGTNGRDGTNGTNGTNGADGKNCYIKYSTTNNITGATDTWTQGQTWIGFALSNSQTIPTDNASYKWSKLIDDSIRMSINTASINISASSSTYYYLGQTVSGTISGMATIVLTNCAGTLDINGNNSAIYLNNCPQLEVTGITESNYINVVRDGFIKQTFSKESGNLNWFVGHFRTGSGIIQVNENSYTSGNGIIVIDKATMHITKFNLINLVFQQSAIITGGEVEGNLGIKPFKNNDNIKQFYGSCGVYNGERYLRQIYADGDIGIDVVNNLYNKSIAVTL